VSLASSGASRGTDERTLVANLGATPAVAQVNLFMDGRGDPFGSVKTANAAGQAKALHPMPFIATVQREADVLQLLSLQPGDPGTRTKAGELSCLLSHLTLPSSAEVWNGETRMTRDAALAADQQLLLRLAPVPSPCGARRARHRRDARSSCVDHGFAAQPARRIAITHAAQSPRGRGTLAIWFQAADGLDEAGFATFRREFTARKFAVRNEGATLHLTAAGRQGELRLSANPERQTREVLAGGEPDALLSVNGIDHGQALLAAWRGKAP
jgi:hypothetical protein